MNTLQTHYQAVIDHIAADIQKNRQQTETELLQTYYDWLVCRKDTLNERRDRDISGFKNRLDAYLCQCEKFWKVRHERTYEKKLDELFEVKKRVIKIYSLSGFDACYALMLALKPMRSVLPLPQYDEHAPALAALEAIKDNCYRQLVTYLKF
jgi:hypothetical protein